MKATDSLHKVFGKVLVFSFVAVLILNLAEEHLHPFLSELSNRSFTRYTAIVLVLLALGTLLLHQRFFKKIRRAPTIDSAQIMKLRVEVGGLVKLKEPDLDVDHCERVEKWLVKNVKIAQVPGLIQKGELQFTDGGNDYDLLVDFIELEDGSGKILETLAVDAGNAKQIAFIQKLGKCHLAWRCDHINRG